MAAKALVQRGVLAGRACREGAPIVLRVLLRDPAVLFPGKHRKRLDGEVYEDSIWCAQSAVRTRGWSLRLARLPTGTWKRVGEDLKARLPEGRPTVGKERIAIACPGSKG